MCTPPIFFIQSSSNEHLDCFHILTIIIESSMNTVQFSCLTLCDPMDCSTPGFLVHLQFPEPTQTHVHCISDAIQLSHPLLSPAPPTFDYFHLRVFSNELVLCIRWPKYWSFSFSISPSNEYLGLISFGINWFDLLAVQGTLKESSPTPQFKCISS